MSEYRTIKAAGQADLVIKKSRFICQVGRVHTEAEAQAFIAGVRKQEPKATHHVPAYQLGDDDHIQRAADDGEPAGTAGVPMLKTLQEMGLHDVIAVTTRYFGGIKLGAGGLIRAYANSVVAAVHQVGIVKRVMRQTMNLAVPYPQLDSLQHYLTTNAIALLNSEYGAAVTLTIAVPESEAAAVATAITNQTAGKVTITLGPLQASEVPVTG